MKYSSPRGRICLDEVVESLPIPEFDGTMFGSEAINLDPLVVAELKEYVHFIAESYRENVSSNALFEPLASIFIHAFSKQGILCFFFLLTLFVMFPDRHIF